MSDLSDAVERLQSTVAALGESEFNNLFQDVVAQLKDRAPYGMFEDTLVRHLWDEYCWSCLKGPPQFGYKFDCMVGAVIDTTLDQKSSHVLTCLTAYSKEQIEPYFEDEDPEFGTIDRASIIRACMQKISEVASGRNLDVLGPEGCYVIGGYVTADSPAFSSYDSDSLAAYIDELIDPDGDLESIADEIAEIYLSGLSEESSNPDLDDFFDRYGDEINAMIKAKEIIPALEEVRSELLAELDG